MVTRTRRLSDLTRGESAVVESFTDEILQLKLLEMGCLPGETVMMERIAPPGDPFAIRVAGSVISIRRDEADQVIIRD